MKVLIATLALLMLQSCNTVIEYDPPTGETVVQDTTKMKQDTTVTAAKDHPKTIFIASGFEPMWNLQLLMTQDGNYPINYVDVTGEMTGSLKKVSENVFEGVLKKNGGEESSIKLVISNTPCMREDGKTKDPYTATITINGNTSSGCCRKL